MKTKLLKRALAVALAVTMLTPMTVMPGTGFSALNVFAVNNSAPSVIDSGTCGETAAYTLDSEGTLTISGSGIISESAFAVGVYSHAEDITSIVFAPGSSITEIGAYAFSGLSDLQTVQLPETVGSIGHHTFSECSALTTVTVASSENLAIADSAFGECSGLTSVTIDSVFVKLHPDAFSGSENIETIAFTAFDGTTIQGALYGLPETATVTVTPFSKIYTPAGKNFYGPGVAYDTYQPAYDHAVLYWEDTEPIIEAALADEAGVSIRDIRDDLAWLSNDNIGGIFTDAQSVVVGTMEGDGSFEDPLQIWDAQNWRYLDYMARLGKLRGSYYGWDRGTNVKLMADITLSDKDGTFTTIGGGKHKEIHNADYAYVGNFDGDGHTITLDVNASVDDGEEGFGLFAHTDGAYIKNLNISGRVVSSEVYTGLFIGYGSTDWIYNCSSDAEIVLKGSGEMRSGSFVGYSYHTSLENCHFTGKILSDSSEGGAVSAVGGFVGYLNGSNASSRTMKNCYFAPSEIDVSSEGSAILYRPYYGFYSGFVGYETVENNYYNHEALKLCGDNMGDLDQGMSDAEGIDSLNETEFWEDGQITMPKATAVANPGTRNFVYTGGEHRIFMDLQADAYHYSSSKCINKGDSFPYMPGYAHNGIAQYKVNDGEWSATPPVATEVGEYTVYYRVSGDAYHRDSDIQSIQVTIAEPQELPGSGTAADPYTISNDLEWSILCDMRDTKDKYFKLVNDIVVSEDRESKRGPNHPLEFNGTFDGDGHTITLYYVSRGTSDSLFGRIYGKWSYDTSSYNQVGVKNLIVDGVMYTGGGCNAPIAHTIGNNATVSNIISNMTIVDTHAGGDQNVSGIVVTGDLGEAARSGSYYYNCKVGGKFSAAGGDTTFAGLTFMNDFWKSGTGFLVKDSYVNPVCEDIKVSNGNSVILKNHVEGKSTIENTFYGQSILSIIPVDEETGLTTNTQGISDENGLDALYATGYWADGNPTMPKAIITKAKDKTTLLYTEEETTATNVKTGEEETIMQSAQQPLIEEQTAQGGTVWYQVNGGEWSTEIPTAAEAGKYTIKYKAVGDYLHRDSDTETAVTNIVYDWTTPTGVTAELDTLPADDYGALTSGGNAALNISWDNDNDIEQCNFTVDIVTPNGQKGTLIESAPVSRENWYELTTDKASARFFVGLLGRNDEQVFENGSVNGAKYGDTIIVTATGVVTINNEKIESFPSMGVDLTAGISNTGKTFPVLEDGMSNDSGIKSDVIVLGDDVLVEGLASGGTAPYQFEFSYKKAGDANFTVSRNYSKEQIFTFKPSSADNYVIRVNAKDSNGTVAGKDLTVKVNKVLGNLSGISANEIVIGDTVTVNADAEGGKGIYKYKVSYKEADSAVFITAQEYSENAAVTITPASVGNCTVNISVKDSRGIEVTKQFNVKVNKLLENDSVISADKIVIGSSVTLTGAASGGMAPYSYAFYFRKTGESNWTVKGTEYGSANTVTLLPGTITEYEIKINAKDSRGIIETKNFTVNVNKTLMNTSSISEEEIVIGDSITISSKAEGGIAPYKFKITSKKEGSDEVNTIQQYSSEAFAEYVPDETGSYTINVYAKDSKGTVVTKSFNLNVNKLLTNISGISAEEIVIGDIVTISSGAEGGIAPYQFEITSKTEGSDEINTIQQYSDNSQVSFTPDKVGIYTLSVNVKDARGVTAAKNLTLKVNNVLENNSKVSAEEVVLGSSVTLKGQAAGGIAPYKYAFYFRKSGESNWTVKGTEYGTANSASLLPGTATTYEVKISVKDNTGKILSKTFNIKVNPQLVNNSKVSTTITMASGNVTLIGNASGGIAPYKYSFYYKKNEDTTWTVIGSEYGTETSAVLTPDTVTIYNVKINVKDNEGTVRSKTFEIKVNPELENKSAVSTENTTVSCNVLITGGAEGGIPEYAYSFCYKKSSDSDWTIIGTEFGEETDAQFTPDTASGYNVKVTVKDSLNNVKEKIFDINVNPELENNSGVSTTTAEVGTKITLTGAASEGTAPYKYSYYFKKSSDTSWSVKGTEYGTETTATLLPGTATTYNVRISVKDSAGCVQTKAFDINVYPSLKNNSKVSSSSVVSGNSVTLTGEAAGGTSPYKYAYYYKKNSDTSWNVIETGYNTETNAEIIPDTETVYNIKIGVMDSTGNVKFRTFNINVGAALENTSKVSTTSVTIGRSVTLTGSAAGGTAPYKYAFYFKKSSDTNWSIKGTEYGTETTATLTPGTATTYNVKIGVKDSTGSVNFKTFDISAGQPFVNNSKVSTTVTTVGKTVTLTGAASGGTAPYKYAFYFKKSIDTVWSIKGTEYGTAATAVLKPACATVYNVKIGVKDSTGSVRLKTFNIKVGPALSNDSMVSTTTAAIGSSVTLVGEASGGTAPYSYAFYYKKNSDTEWSAVGSEYGTEIDAEITLDTVATYDVKISVKDSAGSIEIKTFEIKSVPELSNESEVSTANITAGSNVTLTGLASGGTAPYRYAFYFKKSSDTAWSVKGTEFGTETTAILTPGTATVYNVNISVMDSEGNIQSKTFDINVLPALVNNSYVSTATAAVGSSITLTGSAVGGTAPYKYAFYYKKNSDTTWTIKGTEYGTQTTAELTPDTATTYNVRISVKDKDGTVRTKTFDIKSEPVLSNDSTVSAAQTTVGRSVTLTGAASGGTAPYRYAFYFKKSSDTVWSVKGTEYGSDASAVLTPGMATTYNVKIGIMDSTGNIQIKTFDIDVDKALVNNSRLSTTSAKVGSKVTLTGSASGGTAPYKYAFYFRKNGETEWKVKGTEYGTDTTAVLNPVTATTYEVKINVKDSAGNVQSKTFIIKVTSELVNNSTVSATSVKIGRSVTLTGAASGGTAPYKYAFYFRKSGETEWKVKGTEFGDETTAVLTPGTATIYDVKISVKDSEGNIISKTFDINAATASDN